MTVDKVIVELNIVSSSNLLLSGISDNTVILGGFEVRSRGDLSSGCIHIENCASP
jgi:hypothetical protein